MRPRWPRAIEAGAKIIGVNNRNLRTLAVDLDASDRVISILPPDVVAVSESGLKSRSDIERLSALGYRAFLVGERLMTADDPARSFGRSDRPPTATGPSSETGLPACS